ncbi:MAG: hypothetical protein FJ167_00615 [Gammaproteobacteria bacterium]|nr:hypothetical protein [Gammaproteobacteria bacterium]MBM4238409.1 hypothetical protein [Gammaproteobacteria bacterium]
MLARICSVCSTPTMREKDSLANS